MSNVYGTRVMTARRNLSHYLAATFAGISDVELTNYAAVPTDSGRVDQLVLFVTDAVAVQLEDDIRGLEREGRSPTSHLLLLGLEDHAFFVQVRKALGEHGELAQYLLEQGFVDVAIVKSSGWLNEVTRIIARTASTQGGDLSSSSFWVAVAKNGSLYNSATRTFEQ